MSQTQNTTRGAPRIDSAASAKVLIGTLNSTMEDLLTLIQYETLLVKTGRLKAASELSADKDKKSADYTKMMLVARDQIAALTQYDPDGMRALMHRHDLFRAEVQINLAVLATARDVAEDLLRSVASEVGSTQSAAGYGRGGAPLQTNAVSARGIAVNRNL